MRLFILASLLCYISLNPIQAQGWMNAALGSPLDELQDITATSDGGYIAVGGGSGNNQDGTLLIKYDSEGREEWETYLSFFGTDPGGFLSLNIGLAIVETENAYVIAEYANEIGTESQSSLTEISLTGEFIQRNAIERFQISGLLQNEAGELYAIVNQYLNSEPLIIKYSSDIEEIWRTNLTGAAATGFDTHATIDENGHIQYWTFSSTEDDVVIHHEIDSEGNIVRADVYPEFHDDDQADDFLFVRGVLHGALANEKVAFLADGGDYNENLFRELALADINTNEVIAKADISDKYFWITDLHTTDDEVYVSGNVQSGDTVWTRFMVFDDELNVINQFDLNDLISTYEPRALGAVVYDFEIDEFNNLLGAGTMYFRNGGGVGSYGYFSFYLSNEGTLEITSETQDLSRATVELFPNPTTEHITINPDDIDRWSEMSLFSSTGHKIKTYNGLQFPMKIKVGDLSTGTYHLMLTDGQKQLVVPFVKE